MNHKGRRLKRYLGLRREKIHRAVIEKILPSRIIGWAVNQDCNLVEVRLIIGNVLLAQASIDKERPDVSNALGLNGAHGFELILPCEHPSVDWNLEPKLLASSADSKVQEQAFLIGQKKQTEHELRNILNSGLLGYEGHIDGFLNDGYIHGWAKRKNNESFAKIWINAIGIEPESIICDLSRGDMEQDNDCGFELNPQNLSSIWGGKSVTFSFDKEGNFPIPQLIKIEIPKITVNNEVIKVSLNQLESNEDYKEEASSATDDLKPYWEELERYRIFLNELETQLDKSDKIKKNRKKVNFIRRMLRLI